MAHQCQYCANLSVSLLVDLAEKEFESYIFPQRASYRHHCSFENLEKSAENGCDFCQLVLECFKCTPADDDLPQDWPSEWIGPECATERSMYGIAKSLPISDVKICIASDSVPYGEPLEKVRVFDAIMVQVGPRAENDEDDWTWGMPPLVLTLSTPREKAAYIGQYRIGRLQFDSNLGSDANYAIANQWLRTCRASHQKCLSSSVPKLPTRVIDVGIIDSSQKLRLVHSRGATAEYVALSHCWGGRISPLLTTETLATFQNEIPYTALPSNFQDAITITRNLGIQYLWIDSFCILQDSKQDWEHESKQMGLIYRNSTVTISAAASRGSTHGILKSGEDVKHNPMARSLRLGGSNRENTEVIVERRDVDRENLKRLQIYGPLGRRGWTLQESILSPRHLYYGARQLYWRCPEGYESADGAPLGLETPEDTYDELPCVLYSDILRQPQSKPFDISTLLSDYYRMVTEYSQRELTFDSDKLPAFSGLVQRLHPALGGNYLAGLWSSDLARGLLWYKEMVTCNHVQPYRAPSWSWAVTNEPVITQTDALEPGPWDMQLLDHSIIHRDTSNPYGEITSGHIIVEGLTMPLVRSKQVVESLRADDVMGGVHFDERKGTEAESMISSLCPVKDDAGIYLLSIHTEYGNHHGWEIDFDSYHSEHYTALFVHISESDIKGVVLQPVDVRSDSAYKRVGYFEIFETAEPYSTWVQIMTRQTLTLV